jgi:hypothetical protein
MRLSLRGLGWFMPMPVASGSAWSSLKAAPLLPPAGSRRATRSISLPGFAAEHLRRRDEIDGLPGFADLTFQVNSPIT